VHAGNETAGRYSHESLWKLLDERLPRHLYPSLIRGDVGFGNEETMAGCEKRNVKYLFKLRLTGNVKKLLGELEKDNFWKNAGEGWEGSEGKLQLSGWSSSRRIIVLRRRKQKKTTVNTQALLSGEEQRVEQGLLFPEVMGESDSPEYDLAVLVTNLDYSIEALGQLYRDRGDCENIFDELKNQWGWCGFTTQDIKRSAIMAGFVALIYNWWNIFCRLAKPDKHLEARTSRPLLQRVIGRLTNHGGKRLIHLSATGAQATETKRLFEEISAFLNKLMSTAAQLNRVYIWTNILARAFKHFLRGKPIFPAAEENQLLLPIVT